MSRVAKMSARYMGNRGFSIGIDDVTPSSILQGKKGSVVSEGYEKCDGYISQYRAGKLQLQPGCNLEQSLEAEVTGVLNNIREEAGKVCMATLHYHNAPLIMSQCGSKGSPINISQMVACVGQQTVGGKRAPNGFTDRTLPHFPRQAAVTAALASEALLALLLTICALHTNRTGRRGDKAPGGKGFVANSFYSGLSALEFWFHTMGGREGLVDTAVKTAETGYMSRRLMKALEDLFVHYDYTVRNSSGGIIQLVYGDDGLDPMLMEGKDGKPLDFNRTLMNTRALVPFRPDDNVPLPADLQAKVGDVAAVLRRYDGVPDSLAKDLEEQMVQRVKVGGALREAVAPQVGRVRSRPLALPQSYAAARQRLGLPEGRRGDKSLERLAGYEGFTERELGFIQRLVMRKFDQKRVDPGSTVGAFGAQSIGEPGTQMTLKTFHFAGVASMNVTLGVPRIKEIINAAKTISTPIMRVSGCMGLGAGCPDGCPKAPPSFPPHPRRSRWRWTTTRRLPGSSRPGLRRRRLARSADT